MPGWGWLIVGFVLGIYVGAVWGQRLEKKAVAKIIKAKDLIDVDIDRAKLVYTQLRQRVAKYL